MPCSINSRAFPNKAAEKMTAVVVPSPISSSIDLATFTIIFAATLSISSFFNISAPSFVIVTSPIESTSILFIPFGPRVDFTDSVIARIAFMFCIRASFSLVVSVPSFNIIIGTDISFFSFIVFQN